MGHLMIQFNVTIAKKKTMIKVGFCTVFQLNNLSFDSICFGNCMFFNNILM